MLKRAVRITTTNEFMASMLAREFNLEVESFPRKWLWWNLKPLLSVTYVYPADGHWRTDYGVTKFRLRAGRLALSSSWTVADYSEELIDSYNVG